jgi:DNA-binding NarL/FixJ family response regulator
VTAPVQAGPSPVGGGPAPYPAVRHHAPDPKNPRTYITNREIRVLRLVANGNTNRLIGRRLEVGEEAIKSHMQSILRKLRVRDRAQAVAVGLALGLLVMSDIEVPADANRGYGDAE